MTRMASGIVMTYNGRFGFEGASLRRPNFAITIKANARRLDLRGGLTTGNNFFICQVPSILVHASRWRYRESVL